MKKITISGIGDDVIFKDMIMLMLMGFIVLFFILIPFINPGKKDENKNEEIKSPGSLVIYGYWTNGTDVDLDLWIKSPDDSVIGYPNRENKSCNLLRDDLGKTGDLTVNNFENIFCRKIYEGEYILNMHVYSFKDSNVQKVDFLVKIELIDFEAKPGVKFSKEFDKMTVYRQDQGKEFTIVRFMVNEKGEIIESSLNNDFISIIKLDR